MRLNKELAKYYYTAAQAREILGLDEQAFQYQVRKGRITKTVLPDMSQGVYSRKEIDRKATTIEAAIIAEQPEGIEFRKANIEDLEAEYELSHLIFGKSAHTLEVRRSFLERNPDIDYHLYDQDKLAAFIQIIPFTKEAIEDFTSGRLNGDQLDLNTIEKLEPGKPLECIVMEMATTPTVPPQERTTYGAQLILGLSDVLREWGEKGIIITKLHATSSTPTGIRIMQTAGFQRVKEVGRPGRFAFELDVQASDTKVFRGYKDAIKAREAREKRRRNK